MASARLPPQNYSPRLAARRGGAAGANDKPHNAPGRLVRAAPTTPCGSGRGWERGGVPGWWLCSAVAPAADPDLRRRRVGSGRCLPARASQLRRGRRGSRGRPRLQPRCRGSRPAGRAGEGGAGRGEQRRGRRAGRGAALSWPPRGSGGRRGTSLRERVRSSPGRACGTSFPRILFCHGRVA